MYMSQAFAKLFILPDVTGYVAEIYETLVNTPREELKHLEEELKQNVPEPLHSMLEKETKEEAIEKHKTRNKKKLLFVVQHAQVNLRLAVIL